MSRKSNWQKISKIVETVVLSFSILALVTYVFGRVQLINIFSTWGIGTAIRISVNEAIFHGAKFIYYNLVFLVFLFFGLFWLWRWSWKGAFCERIISISTLFLLTYLKLIRLIFLDVESLFCSTSNILSLSDITSPLFCISFWILLFFIQKMRNQCNRYIQYKRRMKKIIYFYNNVIENVLFSMAMATTWLMLSLLLFWSLLLISAERGVEIAEERIQKAPVVTLSFRDQNLTTTQIQPIQSLRLLWFDENQIIVFSRLKKIDGKYKPQDVWIIERDAINYFIIDQSVLNEKEQYDELKVIFNCKSFAFSVSNEQICVPSRAAATKK